MRRTVLVLALLAALSVASGSSVNASPAIGERAVAVSGWFSFYIADYLRSYLYVSVDECGISTGGGRTILGGDADDWANGKDDKHPKPDNDWGSGVLGGSNQLPSGRKPAGVYTISAIR